jgi:hypothetical protein
MVKPKICYACRRWRQHSGVFRKGWLATRENGPSPELRDWNGENGRTIMYQSEMPYDPPSQADWSHDGVNGFASYKVADSVKTHEGWGLGVYSFFNQGVPIHAERAFEVPNTAGVKLHDLVTVFLTGSGGIDHVVNNTGAAVNSTNQVTNIVSYP